MSNNKILGHSLHVLSFVILLLAFLLFVSWEFHYRLWGPPVVYLDSPPPKITNLAGIEGSIEPGDVILVHSHFIVRDPQCHRIYTRHLVHQGTGTITDLVGSQGHIFSEGPTFLQFRVMLPKTILPGEYDYVFVARWKCNPLTDWLGGQRIPFEVREKIVRLDPFTGENGAALERRVEALEQASQ